MLTAMVRRLAALCYRVDTAVTRWIKDRQGDILYEVRGSCQGCGGCCETPMLAVSRFIYHSHRIRQTYLWWQEKVNGFVLLREEHEGHVFVFRCRHYNRETKHCDCYRSRPGVCRDYPHNLLDSASPEFLESCGYYPHYRNADAFKEALDELELEPAKRAEVERKLHLRD